jgi:hypothetical protein
MHLIVAQILWFGLAALVILVDRKLVAAAQPVTPDGASLDNYDITDRGIGSYLLLQVLFGGFVIPFYMWNSRKTGAAVAAGIALMLVCACVVGIALTALGPERY